MAPINETSGTQYANNVSNPLTMIIEENIPIRAVSGEFIEEIFYPEEALSEEFLNYINNGDPEVVATEKDNFPNKEDISNLLVDEFPIDQALSRFSIENFDEGFLEMVDDEEEEVSSSEMVIEGLNEFLQVPSVIAFQVPPKMHDEILMTVVNHSNYTQLENCSESAWQFSSPYYSQSPSSYSQQCLSPSSSLSSGYSSLPSPVNSSSFPVTFSSGLSSSNLKKRGRKPKQWKSEVFSKEYLEDAKSHNDELKRRNNISSGLYRQRKTETIEKMEAEIVTETNKKVSLKKEHKKLKKQIIKLKDKLSLCYGVNQPQQYNSFNSNTIFTDF